MFSPDVDAGGGTGDFTQSANGSAPIKWLSGNMNPFQWTFLNEPAWKWMTFFIACSLFGVAWAGVVRYMK